MALRSVITPKEIRSRPRKRLPSLHFRHKHKVSGDGGALAVGLETSHVPDSDVCQDSTLGQEPKGCLESTPCVDMFLGPEIKPPAKIRLCLPSSLHFPTLEPESMESCSSSWETFDFGRGDITSCSELSSSSDDESVSLEKEIYERSLSPEVDSFPENNSSPDRHGSPGRTPTPELNISCEYIPKTTDLPAPIRENDLTTEHPPTSNQGGSLEQHEDGARDGGGESTEGQCPPSAKPWTCWYNDLRTPHWKRRHLHEARIKHNLKLYGLHDPALHAKLQPTILRQKMARIKELRAQIERAFSRIYNKRAPPRRSSRPRRSEGLFRNLCSRGD
ncbi:hypothetical protein ACOMHN_060883 [Nucella lapillus]